MDPILLTRIIGHGLSTGGRYLAVRIAGLAIDEVEVQLTLETRGPAHRDDVLGALEHAEYAVRVQD